MNWFEKIVYFLQGDMTRPTPYGWFHLLAFGLVIALTVLLCVFFKDATDRTYRIIVLAVWCVIALGEIYKQTVFAMSWDGAVVTWDYAWYAFPYQFCSTPLYILPFVALLPEGRVRRAMMMFTGTFAFFGGIAVMFYPGDVFIETIGINIQTMIHHGSQVILGIYTIVYTRRNLKVLSWLSAIPVFAVLVAVAVGLNLGVYHAFAAKGIEDTFNMFFVSPYFECTLPVLSGIYPLVPYAVFLITYILGFGVVAGIMYYAQWGIIKLCHFLKEKRKRA